MEDIDREEEEEEDEEIDIDSSDTKNPLAVSEYIDDIYTYYKKMEVKYLLSRSITSEFGLFSSLILWSLFSFLPFMLLCIVITRNCNNILLLASCLMR